MAIDVKSFEFVSNLHSFGHVLFDHEVDPVQRALQILFSQIHREGLKVGGAMFISSKCTTK